ncbi:MAG: type II toxin-antitoxin system ParD family antitoxin [Bacteroidetes bacterium]|nr:type II toxin-antitoxin system ParD family antitoxin [Bacteroidota bacterium]
MIRITSISLDDYSENFVDNSKAEGRFKNACEMTSAELRLQGAEENKLVALKRAIQEGTESGIADNFNPEEQLKSLKAKKKNC